MHRSLPRAFAPLLLAAAINGRSTSAAPATDPPAEKPRPAVPFLAAEAASTATVAPRSPQATLPSPVVPPLDRVLFDRQPDGSLWARGERYKVHFRGDGVDYVPFLGSGAPRNYPIRFRLRAAEVGGEALALEAAAGPQVTGSRVTLDRGALVERYDLALGSVEQSFDVPRVAHSGDLVLRIAVETELATEPDGTGLRFTSSLGHVSYAQARAVDARGRSLDLTLRAVQGEVELRVPAPFLAAADWPLCVDPVISTYPIDLSPADCFLPDLAFEAGSSTWRAVYEEVYSATDHDIVTYHFSYGGLWNPILRDYVDFTTAYCAEPRIAANRQASTFLVVFTRGRPGLDLRVIQGRLTPAGATSFGAVFDVQSGTGYDLHAPDVGGDPALVTPTNYLVVWQREYSATDTDVHARLVSSSGAPLTAFYIDDSAGTRDAAPRVSKTNGHLSSYGFQRWNVAWERRDDGSIRAAQYLYDGTAAAPSFQVVAGGLFWKSAPSPSSLDDGSPTGRRWLIAYESTSGITTDADIAGTLLEDGNVRQHADLTAFESPSILGRQQAGPSADCDGSRFAVAYSELYPGGTYHAYVASFQAVGAALGFMEGHQALEFTANWNGNLEICADDGAPGRFLAGWTRATGGGPPSDIMLGAYETARFTSFCFPGEGAVPCACGNPPAGPGLGCGNSASSAGSALVATGDPLADTVVLQAGSLPPSATCLFTQASATSGGVVFGDGVRCVSGTILRMYTKAASGGVATAPQPGDPSIRARAAALGDVIAPGARRYYQVYYRDPQSYGCAATFNMSPALQVDW
jgi:hypothetical protein